MFFDKEESWWIPGFEGHYSITRNGVITSWKYNKTRTLKPKNDRDGYLCICLCKDNKSTYHRIHNLVLRTFIGPPPSGMIGLHINGNKSHNNVNNLKWGTHQENMDQGKERHEFVYGSGHHNSKLTEKDVLNIREIYDESLRINVVLSQEEIAEEYDISPATVAAVIRGNTWQHVGGPRHNGMRYGVNHHYTKYTEDQVRCIREAYDRGTSLTELARELNSNRRTMSDIVHRKTWKHIP